MNDLVLSVRAQDVINYTIHRDASRTMFLQGDVIDALPLAAKGKVARIAYSTKASDCLPDRAWTEDHDGNCQANITVSEAFMDHLLLLIRDQGVKNLFLSVHGKADENEINGKKPDDLYEVTFFEVRYDGPAGQC